MCSIIDNMQQNFTNLIDESLDNICGSISDQFGHGIKFNKGDLLNHLKSININSRIKPTDALIDTEKIDEPKREDISKNDNVKKKDTLKIEEVKKEDTRKVNKTKKKDTLKIEEVKKEDTPKNNQIEKEKKVFIEGVDYDKCMARTWDSGNGCQCTKSRKTGDYCGLHYKKFMSDQPWHLGRIDQERPDIDYRTDKKIPWKSKKVPIKEIEVNVKEDIVEQDIIKEVIVEQNIVKEDIDEQDIVNNKKVVEKKQEKDEQMDNDELEKENYDSDSDTEEIECNEVIINDKDYFLDKKTNRVYSIDNHECIGIYNDETGNIDNI